MNVGELLRALHDDGWRLVAARGSHRRYNIRSNPDGSSFLANRATILPLAHCRVFSTSAS